MGKRVSIIGIGSTQFGVLEGRSLKEIATDACNQAIEDAGVNRSLIQSFYLGNYVAGQLVHQETIAPLIANCIGLRKDIAATKVEGACCSGGIALRHGYLLIATGYYDMVLIAGVEKMTSASTEKNTEALASAMDWEEEGRMGLTFPGFFGIIAHRYMHEYGVTMEQISQVSVKNRKNGCFNPRARFRKEIDVRTACSSKMIADPLRLYDCCPIADGASALLLCSAEKAREFTSKPIDIIGCGQALGFSTTFENDGLTGMVATQLAAKQAFQMAGIAPNDVDVAEVHDCFSIAEVVDTEDLGFFSKGEGAFAAVDGKTDVNGSVAVNPSGGLLSKGHPVGATGVGQAYEIVRQLRGDHENQIEKCEIGLVHNLGATGQICTVHIFRRG